MKQVIPPAKVKRLGISLRNIGAGATLGAALGVAALAPCTVYAAQQQPPAPCHPNPHAAEDRETILNRGDIRRLPDALETRLAELAGRPHSQLPTQAYAEAATQRKEFAGQAAQAVQSEIDRQAARQAKTGA